METSYLKTLELDKIIARAAEGCVCKEAKAKLLALEPQCDPDEVRYALEQTDAINTLLIKNGSPRFGGVEGVSALAARAVKGGVLSMGELLMVAGALRNFQNLTNWYGSSEHDMLPTDDLFYALSPEPGLEQQISSAILAPDAMADTASRTLNDLRKKIRATENSIRDRLESMVRNMDTSKYLQESVVSMRNGRYVVPVKSEYRGEVSGIIHDVSSTGATVFVEPQAVVEANARILQYRAQEAQEIERILVAFTAQVAAIEPQFQYSYQAMLDIDVLLAKARLALELKAFKPAVRTDNSFSLIRARHPLIDPQKCVPVDIALGKEYDSLIITGPNTGGKTVTLKTAGLLCAMAQCGFLIPADERSEVCVFDEFLVDIGDEQSIEQSLSTFSGHMKKITGILELAMPHTLVLLDELEKAHRDVWSILLQVMEEGVLTDAQGRKTDFRNTVLVMTSNLGARHFHQKARLGFSQGPEADRSALEQAVLREARNTFAPEFFNRLDAALVFHPLDSQTLAAITQQMLSQTGERLSAMGIGLQVEPEAVHLLAQTGAGQDYGARPLRRAIAAQVEDPAADLMLEGCLKKGDSLQVWAEEGQIRVGPAGFPNLRQS